MTGTTRQTVKHLFKSILSRLETRRAIAMPAEERVSAQEELESKVGTLILTEEDLKMRTLDMMGARAELLADEHFTESAQFRAAKSVVRKSFGDNELNGLYFQKTLKEVADHIIEYLMNSPRVEEVFEDDSELEKMIVEIVRRFNPAQMS